jgi:hypothetical protein
MEAKDRDRLERVAAAIVALAKDIPKEFGKRRAMLRTKATEDCKLTRTDLIVFDRLLGFTDWDEHGYCFPRYETIAAGKRSAKPVSRRAVADSLKRLDKNGYIISKQHRWRGFQATNRYTFPLLVPECKTGCDPECRPECNSECKSECSGMHDQSAVCLHSQEYTSPQTMPEKESDSSSDPVDLSSTLTTSEPGAARARGEATKQDDDQSGPTDLDAQQPEEISVEAGKWLSDKTGLSAHKIVQRAVNVGVGFALYDQAIRITRTRYDTGEIKQTSGLPGYVDTTARNLAKGTRAPISPHRRPLIGFEQLSAALQAAEPDLLADPEIPRPPRRPTSPSASLLNSALVKR